MVYNTTFNNISVLSWQSVLLVEETGVTGENHQPVASNLQTLSHNDMFYWVNLAWTGFELSTLVVIGTDCIGNYKPNYHTIMTMKASFWVNFGHHVTSNGLNHYLCLLLVAILI